MILPPGVPELVDLDLLLCVERLGSLSKAAHSHSMSQPAASVRMRAVERRLGLQLLERLPTGCKLTPAGRMVAQLAREVINAAGELATRTSALREVRHDRLRVAASLTVAHNLMPRWLVSLREQLPNVAVELQVQNSRYVIEHVSAGHFDLGFAEGACTHADLAQTSIGNDELVLIVAPGHPWSRRATPVTPAELIAGPLVLREQGSGTREALERSLNGLHDKHPHLELASTNAIKAAVANGTGAAVLSLMTVQEELRTGQLVKVPVTGVDLVHKIRATWGANSELSLPAQMLIKIARHNAPPVTQRGKDHIRVLRAAG
ncbi:MAG: LysR family transcriptional regulator [Actinophytocola sp.]|nr:LysR family transcriptional regulator [Actinophytocola sp.]